MKHRKRFSRTLALLLTLVFLLGAVSTGAENTGADTPAPVYSDWLSLEGLLRGESANLADFLYGFDVDGLDPVGGTYTYTILEDVPYTVWLYFREEAGGTQFADSMTYQLPSGFRPQPAPVTKTIDVEGEGGYVRITCVIDANGLMTLTVDPDSPGYTAFKESEKAELNIWIEGIIHNETIEFSDSVTGNFHIDTERSVSVVKAGTYDAELNRVRYTIQASSVGNNTDVHIGDILLGTALTYDPATLTVTSNVSSSVVYNADTREGETFGLTLPSMVHGETVTVEYWADVNFGPPPYSPQQYSTVEFTGNKVNISSREDPPGDEFEIKGDDFQNKISLTQNRKTALSQTVRDGKTYVTWKIILNENANISIAGQSVTDTIDGASQPFMWYSGPGIHVERYEKDGTPAGSEDISWGTGGLTDGSGRSTWTYVIPESDKNHNYRYVITYETEVDSETLLTQTEVKNTVNDGYDPGYGAVFVEPTGEGVEAEKTALESRVNAAAKTAETDWEITFTVPSAGLDSAEIIDTLPARRNVDDNTWFYDTLKNNSVHAEPLLEGEGFQVTEQNHQVLIRFTRNNGEPGLTGKGLPRTVRVRLTTVADPNWLAYAETHFPADPMARTHTNNAIVRVNGQDLNLTSSVTYNTSPYTMEKVLVETYETQTDPALPIYLYKIHLTNVNDAAFGSDDCITIYDTYDSDYLAYHPTYNTDHTEINDYIGHVYGNNQHNKDSLLWGNRGPYVVDDSSTPGQLVFKLHKGNLPMAGETSYHHYYTVVYALQVKDAEALDHMRQEALHSEGLKFGLSNTAQSNNYGSETIVTEYTVHALEKTQVLKPDGTPDEGLNPATGTYDLKFSIDVNPEGLKIGDGDTITLKDTLTSLSFDYTSIRIDPVLEGDILNRTGYSIIFTLHNEQPYTITYTARLIGLQNVQWNNKADLYGYISSVNGTSSADTGGSGTYYNYSMHVKKYAEGNMNHGLAAKFNIYEARVKDSNGADIPVADQTWTLVGTVQTDEPTGLANITEVLHAGDSAPQSLRPYSWHEGNGTEKFGPSYGWRYRLIETEAPEGYQRTDVVYEFGISDIPSYTAPYNYLNHDTVTIVNTPVPAQVELSVGGEKVLVGKELEDLEFTFTLRPEESAAALWGEADPYPGGFDGILSARNNRQGRFSFPLTYTYEDYANADERGFVGDDRSAYFYYVVREEIPEGAEENIWNGVRYDASQYLVVVRLFVSGGQLMTNTRYYPYDGTGVFSD